MNCWSNIFGVNKSVVNIIHELAADVKDSQNHLLFPIQLLSTIIKKKMDAQYTY